VFDQLGNHVPAAGRAHAVASLLGSADGRDDGQATGGDLAAILHNTPTPRGGHSSSAINEEVILLFGGYGGRGFSRRDSNELYALNVADWEWTKLEPKGRAPEPRSAHSAAFVDGQLFICGGWNASSQLKDVSILTVDTLTWTTVDPESSLPHARWSHSMVAVPSVPFSRVFVFGGSSAEKEAGDDDEDGGGAQRGSVGGTYSSKLLLMDTSSCRWIEPSIVGTPPTARQDSAMAFDPEASRLLVFGGWNGRWLGDVRAVDVGAVVGPPYAITAVEPQRGPITGGTHVTLSGVQLRRSDRIVVRFALVAEAGTPGASIMAPSKSQGSGGTASESKGEDASTAMTQPQLESPDVWSVPDALPPTTAELQARLLAEAEAQAKEKSSKQPVFKVGMGRKNTSGASDAGKHKLGPFKDVRATWVSETEVVCDSPNL